MIVQHNLSAMNSNRLLGVNNSNLSKNLEKLSSGYTINRAGDNAAGLAISEKMRAQIAGLEQASTNAEDGISMAQTFEGALEETDAILQRMKTLATQSANGSYDDDVDRAAIELEFDQHTEELNQIADTDFNGVMIINNQDAADKATASGGVTFTYKEDIELQVGARTKDLQKFNFNYEGGPGLGEGKDGALQDDLDCTAAGLGVDLLTLENQEDANEAIDRIGYAINKVSMVRATFGAVQNRLEHKIKNLDVSAENLTAAESRIRDTNMAEEMMEFTKNQILSQSSQSMLAQANTLPQGVLSLLQ